MARPETERPAYRLPFTILVDQREKAPFDFVGYLADQRHGGGGMIVTCSSAHLKTGDYTISGHEDRIAVERKSREDAYGTIGQGRDRFEREIERLNAMPWAAVVVEDSLGHLIESPPVHSQLDPKTIFRSVIAWQQRYPRVHWVFCDSRRLAEAYTLRALERYWRESQKKAEAERREKKEQKVLIPGASTFGLPD
jgi:DNA excision repair protein ERCC-4